jgi:hypothetical protein
VSEANHATTVVVERRDQIGKRLRDSFLAASVQHIVRSVGVDIQKLDIETFTPDTLINRPSQIVSVPQRGANSSRALEIIQQSI